MMLQSVQKHYRVAQPITRRYTIYTDSTAQNLTLLGLLLNFISRTKGNEAQSTSLRFFVSAESRHFSKFSNDGNSDYTSVSLEFQSETN